MHIPDGYLSPSTCAGLYAAAAPFWYVSLNRVKHVLDTRAVPLLAVFAAFSFVAMMFNLPLPGGTTGHATGVGMAAIVLGPWVSILAISLALLIQALFFGDGGITAFGANCFNMAVVGSLVAYGIYRLAGYRARITSVRRIVAAGLAGYVAINAAAFLTACEFGIQPMLFHDAAGTPLYAPYPLSIAIPAMMIGHLTFAGLAEFVISAGLVSYLQRADPELLRLTAGDAPPLAPRSESAAAPAFDLTSRKLWLVLGVALLLTPLGILAVGSAWGEWSPEDFSNADARQEISAASRNAPAPERAPSGLERLSSFWKAPLADYEPAFISSPAAGYLLSAIAGVGCIILFTLGFSWILPRSGARRALQFSDRKRRRDFIERTMDAVLRVADESTSAEHLAQSNGLLQGMDARAKLAGMVALIVAVVAARRLEVVVALFAMSVLVGLLSRVPVALLARRVWIAVLAFTGIIALPAPFLVPGTIVFHLPVLSWPITAQGLTSAALLIMRAEAAATFAFLLILCTPWNRLLKALRFFRIPAIVVLILEMAHRYIFLLLQTTRDMFESRQTRQLNYLDAAEQRRLAASSAGVLLDKSLALSSEVHIAMRARGYRGEVHLMDDLEMRRGDWGQLAGLMAAAALFIWWGR
jgi:cobalt/nickel transport system permease protein